MYLIPHLKMSKDLRKTSPYQGKRPWLYCRPGQVCPPITQHLWQQSERRHVEHHPKKVTPVSSNLLGLEGYWWHSRSPAERQPTRSLGFNQWVLLFEAKLPWSSWDKGRGVPGSWYASMDDIPGHPPSAQCHGTSSPQDFWKGEVRENRFFFWHGLSVSSCEGRSAMNPSHLPQSHYEVVLETYQPQERMTSLGVLSLPIVSGCPTNKFVRGQNTFTVTSQMILF